jgi:hypothetical protein
MTRLSHALVSRRPHVAGLQSKAAVQAAIDTYQQRKGCDPSVENGQYQVSLFAIYEVKRNVPASRQGGSFAQPGRQD